MLYVSKRLPTDRDIPPRNSTPSLNAISLGVVPGSIILCDRGHTEAEHVWSVRVESVALVFVPGGIAALFTAYCPV